MSPEQKMVKKEEDYNYVTMNNKAKSKWTIDFGRERPPPKIEQ